MRVATTTFSIEALPARPHQATRCERADVVVERMAMSEIAAIVPEWVELTTRTLEGNVFLDPAFVLPLVQTMPPGRRPDVLLVWHGIRPRLIGLLPVSLPRVPGLGLARGFADKQVCRGVPLLDREHGAAAFAAMLDWLGRQRSRPAALLLTDVPAEGAFTRQVLAGLGSSGAKVELLASRQRAVLRAARDGSALPPVSAKTRKERKRQKRRLADKGARTYVSARSPEDVARACEAFLALERRGWKGRQGGALLVDPAHATFARAMMRAMAETGRCRIDTLDVGGRPAAMGVVLTSGSTAYFWKTAFDQDLASLSPGVQLAAELTDVQLAEQGVALTDSCAVPDHPMINRLWPDRMDMHDLAIGLRAAPSRQLTAALAFERWRRAVRARAKAARSRFRMARRGVAGR